MLVDGRNTEKPEDDHKNEDIVDGEGLLHDIARQKLQADLSRCGLGIKIRGLQAGAGLVGIPGRHIYTAPS